MVAGSGVACPWAQLGTQLSLVHMPLPNAPAGVQYDHVMPLTMLFASPEK